MVMDKEEDIEVLKGENNFNDLSFYYITTL